MTRYHNNIVIPETAKRLSGIHNASRSLAALLLGSAALLFAPPAALAQNEGCNPGDAPGDNGAAADSYTCSGPHPNGIDYTADGDLGVITSGTINAGTPGVDLTATETDAVDMTAGSSILGSGGLDISTELGALTATFSSVSGGARLTTVGGDLTLNYSEGSPGQLVQASITAGSGNLRLNAAGSSRGTVLVDTTGTTGSTVVDHSYDEFRELSRLDIQAGTGGVDLSLGSIDAPAANPALSVSAESAVAIDVRGLLGLGNNNTIGTQAITISAPSLSMNFSGDPDALGMVDRFTAGIGPNAVGTGFTSGRSTVDLSGVTGVATLAFQSKSRWEVSPIATNVLAAGGNEVTIDETSALYTPFSSSAGTARVTTIDFNGGGTLTNAGHVFTGIFRDNSASFDPGARVSNQPTELRMERLDEFVNSGIIYLGAVLSARGSDAESFFQDTDFWNDDILALPGAQFHGEEGSRILLDVNLSSTLPQQSCDGGVRRANNDMPAADCVDIRGGGATGRTEVRVTDMFPGGRGAYLPDGITIVDLDGADPADIDPEAFTLAPDSTRYTSALGGSVDKGMFLIPLVYDEQAQQFKLATAPSAQAMQQPMMASVAQELWRASSASLLGRQSVVRNADRDGGLGGGLWMKLGSEVTDRSITSVTSAAGNEYSLNNEHEISISNLSLGRDFVFGRGPGPGWLFGGVVGYSTGTIDFDTQPGNFRLDGMNVGVHGGYAGDALYVDLLINQQWFDLDQDQPTLGLQPDTAILNNSGESIGGQAELGWRLRYQGLEFEPMLFASISDTSLDDVRVPGDDPLSDETFGGLNVTWDDAKSRRVGVGLRSGYDMPLNGFVLGFELTGRVIEETEGENVAVIENPAPVDAIVVDDFSGTFFDVVGGVRLSDDSGNLSGVFDFSFRSGDDYSRAGVSVGLEYQW